MTRGGTVRHRRGTGTVTRVAVFGDPVAHSLSPAMHNAAFRASGMRWHYARRRVPKTLLAAELRRAAARGFRGVNLTIPLKEAALPLMDVLTPEARRAGAVNTVTFEGGRMEGHSTDGEGFLRSMAEAWRIRLRGRRVVIMGAGGAARSIAFALVRAGVRSIEILNRHPARARSLARALRGAARAAVRGGRLPESGRWGNRLARVDLLVNATSVGLHGEPSPVPAAAMHPRLRVMDLVYNPPVTELMRASRAAGARAVNGAGMLVHQGALAFERWTGRRAPLSVMRRALAAALPTMPKPLSRALADPAGVGYRKKQGMNGL